MRLNTQAAIYSISSSTINRSIPLINRNQQSISSIRGFHQSTFRAFDKSTNESINPSTYQSRSSDDESPKHSTRSNTQPIKRSRLNRWHRPLIVLTLTTSSLTLLLHSEDFIDQAINQTNSPAARSFFQLLDKLRSYVRIVTRFVRTAFTFTMIALDFKWNDYQSNKLLQSINQSGIAQQSINESINQTINESMDAVHARTAARLLDLAKSNKGLYIKTGQYLSSANHILPAIYQTCLSPLMDAAPVMSEQSIKQLFSEEFPNQSMESLFQYFDWTPVAAASIAQVHICRLLDGTTAAIKLQQKGLQNEFKVDLFAHRCILQAAEFFFPNFQLAWVCYINYLSFTFHH